jgi:Na+-translocating ferredoxin:NAD+ oxidoreductase RnfC subunit
MYDGRHVPLKQLISKLGVAEYDVPAHFRDVHITPHRVRIPLQQHIGAPSLPVVKAGQKVKAGEVIGEIPEGKLGARLHASISGSVTAVNGEIIIEHR